jgi:hypothetical protein
MDDPPKFPVRCRNGVWEALCVADLHEADWVKCPTESDARLVAKSCILQTEIVDRSRSGPQFAAELIECAEALERCGRAHNGHFLRLGAAMAMGEKTELDDLLG